MGQEETYFNLGPFSFLNAKKMYDKSIEVLSKTGIKIPDINIAMSNMSGGQRQCVAISRSAGFASKLIIMDEPTAALGVQETEQVENIIKNLKDRGIPLIMISHNLRQVFDLVDKIWVFRQGKIVGSVDASTTNSNSSIIITGIQQKVGEKQISYENCILLLNE